jgi:heme oxygenase
MSRTTFLQTSLADRLRSDTQALHQRAERTGTMQQLLRGEMSRRAYGALLRNLLAVYAVLEPALQRHAAHPLLAPLHSPALRRAAALRSDLLALEEERGEPLDSLVPATLRYVRRLHVLDLVDPGLLAAHAYVRYLGDLNGGQILKRLVRKNDWMASIDATAFYDFGTPDEAKGLAQGFRTGLGASAWTFDEIDAVVAEACGSFALHIEMFEQLGARERDAQA